MNLHRTTLDRQRKSWVPFVLVHLINVAFNQILWWTNVTLMFGHFNSKCVDGQKSISL